MTRTVLDISASAIEKKPARDLQLQLFLRLDGIAAVAAAVTVYADSGASWWMFFLLLLVPDIAMIGYLGGNRIGAIAYNLVHSYIAPIAFALIGLALAVPLALPIAAIWVAHIGLDRVLGYGLKKTTGFKDTHLGDL